MQPVAEAQLAAWMMLAETWESYRVDDSPVERCVKCGKGIMLVADELGRPYQYAHEQWMALIVLHLRNHHADLDPTEAIQPL